MKTFGLKRYLLDNLRVAFVVLDEESWPGLDDRGFAFRRDLQRAASGDGPSVDLVLLCEQTRAGSSDRTVVRWSAQNFWEELVPLMDLGRLLDLADETLELDDQGTVSRS